MRCWTDLTQQNRNDSEDEMQVSCFTAEHLKDTAKKIFIASMTLRSDAEKCVRNVIVLEGHQFRKFHRF